MSSHQQHHTAFSTTTFAPDDACFFISSTVDDLSYMPSTEEGAQHQTNFVNSGRKNWKTIKGKPEAVWPPKLETCLLEALQQYDPDAIPGKHRRGRFPMRNRFISNYILDKTGKKRSPKQVGSRLQQLLLTCKQEKVLDLIVNSAYPRSAVTAPSPPMPCSDSCTAVSPPTSPSEPSFIAREPFYVDIILPALGVWPSQPPSIDFTGANAPKLQSIYLAPRSAFFSSIFYHDLAPLAFLSGEIEYISPFPLDLRTTFMVYSGDATEPVHIEHSFLNYLFSSCDLSGHHYMSVLVPQLWAKLRSSVDPTQYTIRQINKLLTMEHTHPHSVNDEGVPVIESVYKFTNNTRSISCITDPPSQSVIHPISGVDFPYTECYQSTFTPSPQNSANAAVNSQRSTHQIHNVSTGWIYNPDTGLPMQTEAFSDVIVGGAAPSPGFARTGPGSVKSPSGVAHHIESGCHKFTRHQVTAAVQAMDIVPKITTKTIEGPSGAPVPTIITYIPTSDTFNGNSYSCFLCARGFRILPSLSRHLNSAAHDDNEFRCPKCKTEFTLVSGFVQHLESRACGLAKDKQVENYFTDLADRFSGLLKM